MQTPGMGEGGEVGGRGGPLGMCLQGQPELTSKEHMARSRSTWEEDGRAAETAETRLVQFCRRADLRALARASVVICSFYKPC